MTRPPRPPNQPVLTKKNIALILIQSWIITLISFTVYYLALYKDLIGIPQSDENFKRSIQSLTFSVLTVIQLFHSLLSKSVERSIFQTGLWSNIWLPVSFIIALGILVFGMEVPLVANWLQLTSIKGPGWGIVFICVGIHFVLVEFFKWVVRSYFKTGQDAKEGYTIIKMESLA
jgi:Ca2+-transporting ATPase